MDNEALGAAASGLATKYVALGLAKLLVRKGHLTVEEVRAMMDEAVFGFENAMVQPGLTESQIALLAAARNQLEEQIQLLSTASRGQV